MKFFQRLFAVVTFLIALAVLLLSLAGGIGIWVVKAPVTARATWLFDLIETKLNLADEGLDHIKSSLARASERLDSVKEEQRQIAAQSANTNVTRRFLARTLQQNVAPELNNSHETIHNVAEAAVVVNAMLEDLGSFPLFSVAGVDIGDLTHINSRLSQVESSAWELTRLLGEPAGTPDADAASAQFSRVEQVLKTIMGMIAAYEPKLIHVRERIEQIKTKTFRWLTPAAILLSGLLFWIALSQISVMAHARSWWR